MQNNSETIATIIIMMIPIIMLASWLTHVIVCIKASLWGFLIAGAIFFPVGMVHGFGVWFGAW